MKLELESGKSIDNVTPDDIRRFVPGEEFAILSVDEMTYIQCAPLEDGYVLEYQNGLLEEHYTAFGKIHLEGVLEALVHYWSHDPRWRSAYIWEKQDLNGG